ncbi:Superoxide dismutase [Mn], mitochondrial [Clydaea vesicula]|uniref:Superoxide dismutase n=1 Tax=Clydaea vesicula TaxID=447962 RepID=A0AAD5TXR8_9FUNG|nr:Superoxide dismutase [Mn], mitochondrial [Clydaea vesicula]
MLIFAVADIMKIHHSKHHATYVNMLNQFEEKQHDFLDKNDLTGQLSIQQNLKFNGGGHINHSIFWTNLAPAKKDGGGEPSGAIAEQINKQFGSFNDFKTKFNTAAAGVQG